MAVSLGYLGERGEIRRLCTGGWLVGIGGVGGGVRGLLETGFDNTSSGKGGCGWFERCKRMKGEREKGGVGREEEGDERRSEVRVGMGWSDEVGYSLMIRKIRG